MRIPFIKMHGLGNDFVVLDGRDGKLPPLETQSARAIADRRTGIGCDQVIVLEPSEIADFRMRIHNADGGEVEACGNATRAVAMLYGEPVEIETVAGVLSARPEDGGAAVDMGEPEFGWEEIPLSDAMDTLDMPVGWDELPSHYVTEVNGQVISGQHSVSAGAVAFLRQLSPPMPQQAEKPNEERRRVELRYAVGEPAW